MIKISDFMIGIVFVGLIMTVFSLFMADMNSKYGVTYDNTTLAQFDKINNLTAMTKETEAGTAIEQSPNVLDVIGAYFTDAYNALLLTKASYNVFGEMTDTAISNSNLGTVGNVFQKAILLVVLILIIVAIIISALVKKDV